MLKCPKCRKQLTRLGAKGHYGCTLSLFKCLNCAGLWVDDDALFLLSRDSALEAETNIEESDTAIELSKKPVWCPRCETALIERAGGGLPEGLHIDYCERCEGYWFDKGELKTYKNYLEKKRKQTRELMEEDLRKRNEHIVALEQFMREAETLGEGPTAILYLFGVAFVATFFLFLFIFAGGWLGTFFLCAYLFVYAGLVSFGLNLAVSSETPIEESLVGALGGCVSSSVILAIIEMNAILIYESSQELHPEDSAFLLIAIVAFYLATGPAVLLDTLANGRYRIACQALLLVSSATVFAVLHFIFRICGLFDSSSIYSRSTGLFFVSGAFVAIFLFLWSSYRWDIWRA